MDNYVMFTVPATGSRIKVGSKDGQTVIMPDSGFDHENPEDRSALASMSALYKIAAVVVPGGQAEQAVSTDVPQPGVESFVPMAQYQQDIQSLMQEIQTLRQQVEQALGGPQPPTQPQPQAPPMNDPGLAGPPEPQGLAV